MADYERSTPISYRRSTVTLLVSLTVFLFISYFSTQPNTGNDVIVVTAARRRVTGFKMADSERSTPFSYRCSIVTFLLSCTVSVLLEVFISKAKLH